MKFMDYVKASTIEETALAYQKRGYDVVMSPIDVSYPFESKEQSYDIIALKGEHKIAFEVIAFAKLAKEVMRIAELRRQAKREGFDDFRLVVVREPRQIPLQIEQFEQQLATYLFENMPPEVAALSDDVRVKEVEKLTFDKISLTPSGSRVAGKGLIIIDIYYDEDGERFWEDDDFPFTFDVELDKRLKLKSVHQIEVDTRHFW
jgi:hypothetical protein